VIAYARLRYESGSPHRDHHQFVDWIVTVSRIAGFMGL